MFLVYFIVLLGLFVSIYNITTVKLKTPKHLTLMSWDAGFLSLDIKAGSDSTYQNFLSYIDYLVTIINSNDPDVLIIQKVANIKFLKILVNVIQKKYNTKYDVYGDDVEEQYSVYVISKIKLSNVYRIDKSIHFKMLFNEKIYHIYGVDLYKTIYDSQSMEEHNINVLKDFYKIYLDSKKYSKYNIGIMGNYNTFYGSKALRSIPDLRLVNLNYTQKIKQNLTEKYSDIDDKEGGEYIELNHAYVNDLMFNNVKHFVTTELFHHSMIKNSTHFPIKIIL